MTRTLGRPRALMLSHASGIFGGMEIHVELFLRHLDRNRYAPHFFVLESDPAVPLELIDRVADLEVPIVSDRPSPLSRWSTQAHNIVSFGNVLRRHRIDVLHVHTARPDSPRFPFLGAALAREPVVVRTEHLPPLPTEVTPCVRRSARFFDRLTDCVITVSGQNRNAQLELLDRDPNKLHVVYNGIEIAPLADAAARAETRRRLGLPLDGALVGAVGRLATQKGHEVLIGGIPQLLSSHGNVHVAIAGDGPLRADLQAAVQQLGIGDHVTFLGHVDDARPFIEALDVAVMPSLYEGFSLGMLELMAAAKPCVFSDHASFVEGTDSGRFARLVPVGDAHRLATTIGELLSDEASAADLGRSAREYVTSRFSIARQVSELMDLYDELIERRGSDNG